MANSDMTRKQRVSLRHDATGREPTLRQRTGEAIRRLATRFAAAPWRMSVSDDRDSVRQSRLAFVGPVPPMLWDADLANAIMQQRKAVLEESVVDKLLDDLVR